MFEADPNVTEGSTLNGVHRHHKRTYDLRIDVANIIHKDFDEKLYKELNENLKNYLTSLQEKNVMATIFKNVSDKGFQIQKYKKNDGFFKYHADHSYDDNKKQIRIITFIWYLHP